VTGTRNVLAPLPYHRALVEHLRQAEPELWRWFASAEAGEQHEQVRRDLLRSTYRLEPAAHPEIHASAVRARSVLGIDAELVVYQAQGDAPPNAALVVLGSEAHVVFTGSLTSLLGPAELEAVIAHELGHFALGQLDGGAYLTAERMLAAFANDPRARPAHVESERRFALATEIVADRAGLLVTGELPVAVASLVKTTTGLASVDAASYLRQADEVFAHGDVVSEGVTHPEPFVRARALRLWSEQGEAADEAVEAMVAGPLDLESLDLSAQARLTALTRRLLEAVLAPDWLRSDEVVAHARLFFPDVAPGGTEAAVAAASWREALAQSRPSVADYACYVLLDLVTADAELQDVALAAAFDWSDRLAIGPAFDAVVLKELGMRRTELARRRADAPALLAEAGAR
jgi:hypothetical protein